MAQKPYERIKRSSKMTYLFIIDMKSLNPRESYIEHITSVRNREGHNYLDPVNA